MLEFTEDHSKLLLNSPWLAKVNDNTGYLFKVFAYPEENVCCFLLTDTEHVWVEVLESRHVARRSRLLMEKTTTNEFSEPLDDEEAETAWRKRQIVLLANLHLPQTISDVEFSIQNSTFADMSVSIGTDDFRWRWEVNNPGSRVSSKLLSTHLITPLISFAALSAASTEPLQDMSPLSLARAADAQAKTAKRSLARQMVGAISKPMVGSTLQRMTQVIAGEAIPTPIATAPDDYPPPTEVPPLPISEHSSESKGKRRRTSSPVAKLSSPFSKHNTSAHAAAVGDETEDEEDSFGVPARPAAASSPKARTPSPVKLPNSSQRSSPSEASSPAKSRKPDSDEDSDVAEARRKAAITRITQSKAIKGPAKRRRF